MNNNLIPMSERSKDEVRKIAARGGIKSGETRRRKKTMRDTLLLLLDEKEPKTGKTYRELVTLGLFKGAIKGNAMNYKTMLETLGELNGANDDKRSQEMSKVEELLSKLTDEASK